MYPYTYGLYYGLERQKQLMGEAARELPNLSDGRRFSALWGSLRQAASQVLESLGRSRQVCLELDPACEMPFA
jgi:hypothetical protein